MTNHQRPDIQQAKKRTQSISRVQLKMLHDVVHKCRMRVASSVCRDSKVCAVPEAETNLHRMEALSISRKPLKTRDILDRPHFRQTPPRRSPRASSAAQPIDPVAETAPVHTSVAFLCYQVRLMYTFVYGRQDRRTRRFDALTQDLARLPGQVSGLEPKALSGEPPPRPSWSRALGAPGGALSVRLSA